MKRESDIQVRMGLRIRELRKAKGLSQEDFAFECGLDRTYISGIERGRRNVSVRNIEIIASTLGITISDLFERP
jgi:transcriptional regulator with XRE-family HTH domain